ncbi:MAG: hypothetical protein J1E00_02845 [Oscillospiraceae bacterium]|nr:hypothetical protein [Oscillospiraceae bacterium]
MKKLLRSLLCLLLTLPLLLSVGCASNEQGDPSKDTPADDPSGNPSDDPSVEPDPTPTEPDPRAESLWNSAYADGDAGLTGPKDIYYMTVYQNGNKTMENPAPAADADVRYLFGSLENTRAVVPAEGYAVTLPGVATADYSLGKFRSQYRTEDYVLTLTYEDQNPYGKQNGHTTKDGYDLYMREWLVEQIADTNFLSNNGIMRTRKQEEEETVVGDYSVMTYCMQINLASKMDFPFYQIAIVHPTGNYDYFYLFVLKSRTKMLGEIDSIVASFREIDRVGEPSNGFTSYELKENPNWSEETKAYYEYLLNRTDVGFGAFHERNEDAYTEWLWGPEALNATPDVYMTYLHMGWYDTPSDPTETFERAAKFAGGNGFDGKPVFNLTYQFTVTNNTTGGVYTPMFDILRGKKDEFFRRLAGFIKDYGKPIIFRLNNEMNTDWTDYCGMMTLIDPDIFQMTWRHVYELFEEEGVNNLIWVFNPISTSCPYSNWGEAMCYMPGADYVQILGLTHYEMNNDSSPRSFRNLYTETANKMLPYFSEYPWMLGEFACGAGGETVYDWGKDAYVDLVKGRNLAKQTSWVEGMVDCFRHNQEEDYDFCRRIKLAVWFSSNDYVGSKVTNYLKLDEFCLPTIKALSEYLNNK